MNISNGDWPKITAAVEELCGLIFTTSHQVLKNIEQLGFDNLLLVPKPNAEDKMLQVKVFDSLFSTLITFFEQRDKLELVMPMINARQRILLLEMLINAVKSRDIDECNRLVGLLKNQATLFIVFFT